MNTFRIAGCLLLCSRLQQVTVVSIRSASAVQENIVATATAQRERTRHMQGRAERRIGDRLAIAARNENRLRSDSPSSVRGTPDSFLNVNHTFAFSQDNKRARDETAEEVKTEIRARTRLLNFELLKNKHQFYMSLGNEELAAAVLAKIAEDDY